MKAMILAAGLGTRLRPLTDDRPKALVEVNGRTLLEIALSRLRSLGVNDLIVNAHHHADMIVEYLQVNHGFGMHIEVSREEILLDTGGGLKRAAWFFKESPRSVEKDAPFILHNVDVLSAIDLRRMMRFHNENRALATLAVQDRRSSRHLLFDDQLQLCGRQTGNDKTELARKSEPLSALAFCGIHVISPRLLEMMTEVGAFSIVGTYLRLAAQGEKVQAFRADEYYWRDLGRPDDITQASLDLKHKVIAQ
jgi:NDP-sugar pyrophosphorylase family protein